MLKPCICPAAAGHSWTCECCVGLGPGDRHPGPAMSAGAPATPEPVFSIRTVSLDHYMARPEPGLDVCYSDLEGTVVERVPVVRIFGATPLGQKTCLHLHKVLVA